MGRMEELFYELYASSKRHDSWQRQAMIRELRNLLKQPLSMKMKGNRSDSMVNKIGIPEDQVLNDEELGETEVATDSIETEHETVNLVPEAPEEESIPQVQVPIDNSEIARSIESGKVDLGLEKEVKVETQTIDKGISTLLRGQSKRSTIMESLATMDFVVKPKEISYSHCIAQFHTMLLRLQSKKKQRKCPKCWMFKFRKKKIDQQLGCDLMVTYLENQTTWTSRFDEEDQRNLQSRTENSLSRREISAFIYQAEALLFKSKESAIFANQEPEISATPEPATFQSDNAHGMITRGKDGIVKPNLRYSLLAVQRIWEKVTHDVDIPDAYYVLQEEFEQVENHTPCSVVKLERPQDHDALLLPLPGDERFQIKHKWRFKLLLSILELELYLDSLVLITSYATSLIS